jgi:chemotaxis protein MotB
MRTINIKTTALFICLALIVFLYGCTDWQKKYEYLNVEHENLKGRFDSAQTEKDQLAQRISQDQLTIQELQQQIQESKKSPAEVTGFGAGYDVALDPAAGTITVTLQNEILFDSGKATLKKATSKELDNILSVLNSKYAGKQIDVVGHTDSDPITKTKEVWKDNWELSAERALTVVRYLVQHGIPENQIRASGCGSARPVASNDKAAGKAKNRRVEIVVHMR